MGKGKIWTTVDGERISIRKMSREHIENCIKMLRGGIKRGFLVWLEVCQSNVEETCAAEMLECELKKIQRKFKWVEVFQAELKRRKK